MNLNSTTSYIQKKYQRRKSDKKLELNVWLSVLDMLGFIKILNFRKLEF
jgi:hypothetical protein